MERPRVRAIVLGALLLTIAQSCVSERAVDPKCACDCHGNPACEDTVVDIFDVVRVAEVIRGSADPVIDPNPACPYADTDFNCDGVTDTADVYIVFDVATGIRDRAIICNPCEP